MVQGLTPAQVLQHVADTGEIQAETAVKGPVARHDNDGQEVV